jgi:hypothetical protein
MRALQVLVWLAALVAVCWPWLRRPGALDRRSVPPPADELVKDPVCETYVVRSRAIMRAGPQGPRYFCSDVCARHGA